MSVKCLLTAQGAGRSSEVEPSLMVRWVAGSILHGVDPLSYFSFQPVLHDWCNKGRDMCYPVCGMVHIKEPLLLLDKSSLCGGSRFLFSLSEWSLTICLTPYNRRYNHWRRKRGGKGGMCPPTFLIGGAMVCLCPPTFNPTFLFST